MMDLCGTWEALLTSFSAMFTAPSFGNFTTLATGWVLCVGRRTISRVIQFGEVADDERRHHSIFYRFFSRASWDADELGARVFRLLLPLIPDEWGILLVLDDTLCRKSGPHIWGAGMHHDPLLSSYGRGRKLVKYFSFGHSWVILSVCIPLPWNTDRGIAIPVGFRLYRSKKQCPPEDYRKRTELASEMVQIAATWLPPERTALLVSDTEYACRTVVLKLPERFIFVGPLLMNAALYALPTPSNGRGRPPKKGKRLLSPKQLIDAKHIPWEHRTIMLYGRPVEVLIKIQTCLWYHVAGGRLLRMIVTRDPKGRIEDRAYFTTEPKMGADEIARAFSRRWTQEEMHRNIKQYMGLEDPQNGWWRNPRGQRRDETIPGPQPHAQRGELAVKHTVPFILTTYALVVLWYLANGSPKDDVERVRMRAPWFLHKTEPSFGDMLASLRRHIWAARNISETTVHQGSGKIDEALEDLLCAA